MKVHQLLSGAGPVDAVTNQARAYRRRFAGWGWGGGDFAGKCSPGLEREFAPLGRCRPEPGDVLVLHYSAYSPKLERFLNTGNPLVVVSHNVTPAHWFWDVEPLTAVECTIGREQLPEFAQAADLAVGVSAYNAAELKAAGARRTAVVPILVEPGRLGPPGDAPPVEPGRLAQPGDAPPVGPGRLGPPREAQNGPLRLLFVGRLAPHKRQDLLLRLLALVRREVHPEATLTLVGEPISPPYRASLEALAARLHVDDAVAFERGLSAAELAGRWRSAHAFVCLSEHEGFCIPLLEAFHFGVPVIARAQGGVTEVAADAALLLEPDDGLPVAAECLRAILDDPALRAELRAKGRRRLADFAPDRVAQALRAAIESVSPAGSS